MPIQRLLVVGAGQMGSGIAQVAAEAGLEVVLADATPELSRRGLERVGGALAKRVEKGKLSGQEREAILGRIRPAGSIGDGARGRRRQRPPPPNAGQAGS